MKDSRPVTPDIAIRLASNGDWEGKMKGVNVLWIRRVDPRRNPATLPWQKCWRTCEAAVFPPSADYLAKIAS